MAFTPLDTSDPAQNEFARLGAGRIRDLASAVRERLASIFNDPDVDPLTLKAGTVGAAQIVDGSVGSAELADGGVTGSKLGDGSVTASKVADGSLEIEKLSATARGKLVDRVRLRERSWVGANVIGAHGFIPDWGAPLVPGDYRGKALVAYWGASPAVDLGSDFVKQSIILQPVADATQVGLLLWNQTAFATLDLNGYTVYVDALIEP